MNHVVFPDIASKTAPMLLVVGTIIALSRLNCIRSCSARRSKLGVILASSPLALYLLALSRWGTPAGFISWSALTFVSLLCWWNTQGAGKSQQWSLVVVVLAAALLTGSTRRTCEVDLRNAMRRVGVIGGAKFVRATDATRIIRRHIGKGMPCWGNMNIYSARLFGIPVSEVRDGDSPIDFASPVMDANQLRVILDRLPTEADRISVLESLTDCRSFARWRQNALLVALYASEVGDSEDNGLLWEHHRRFLEQPSHRDRTEESIESLTWLPLLRQFLAHRADGKAKAWDVQVRVLYQACVGYVPDEMLLDLKFNSGRLVHANSTCAQCHDLEGRIGCE